MGKKNPLKSGADLCNEAKRCIIYFVVPTEGCWSFTPLQYGKLQSSASVLFTRPRTGESSLAPSAQDV